MAVSIALAGIMLNSAATPSDAVMLDGVLTDTPDTHGAAQVFGAGRIRWIQPEGRTRDLALTLNTLTDTQLAWLEGHQGQLVCLRDPRGRRHFGVYGRFTAAPWQVGSYSDVSSMTLYRITHPEVV